LIYQSLDYLTPSFLCPRLSLSLAMNPFAVLPLTFLGGRIFPTLVISLYLPSAGFLKPKGSRVPYGGGNCVPRDSLGTPPLNPQFVPPHGFPLCHFSFFPFLGDPSSPVALFSPPGVLLPLSVFSVVFFLAVQSLFFEFCWLPRFFLCFSLTRQSFLFFVRFFLVFVMCSFTLLHQPFRGPAPPSIPCVEYRSLH